MAEKYTESLEISTVKSKEKIKRLMEVERNNGYGGMKKMTLHRIICL